MSYSLTQPLKNLSWFQRLIWPLVYAQLIALKMWVRMHYGRGVSYRFWISPIGRVHLTRLALDLTWSYAAPGALKRPTFDFTCGLSRPVPALAPEGAAFALSFFDAGALRPITIPGNLSTWARFLHGPAPDTS